MSRTSTPFFGAEARVRAEAAVAAAESGNIYLSSAAVVVSPLSNNMIWYGGSDGGDGGVGSIATVNNTVTAGVSSGISSGIYLASEPVQGPPRVEITIKPCAAAFCAGGNNGAWSCTAVGGPFCGDCCKGCSRHTGVVSNIPRKDRAARRRGGVKVKAQKAARS